eukprot:6190296-Pleurochrysis_carterae.AAC.1
MLDCYHDASLIPSRRMLCKLHVVDVESMCHWLAPARAALRTVRLRWSRVRLTDWSTCRREASVCVCACVRACWPERGGEREREGGR